MKKLFTVTIETEIVVLAETAKEAEEYAADELRELDSYQYDFHAMEMAHLPGDWDVKSIPYGDVDEEHPDRTIQEWIDAGSGERYKTALEEHKRLRERFGKDDKTHG